MLATVIRLCIFTNGIEITLVTPS